MTLRHHRSQPSYLFVIVPKGFFPQQDTGRIIGAIQADQSISFQAMREQLTAVGDIVDAAIRRSTTVIGFTGGDAASSATPGSMFVALKPLAERRITADQVIARLRGKLAQIPGRQLYPAGRCRTCASAAVSATRSTSSRCRATTFEDLHRLGAAHAAANCSTAARTASTSTATSRTAGCSRARHRPRHRVAARHDAAAIDDTLYDAFGQRQVSTMYTRSTSITS